MKEIVSYCAWCDTLTFQEVFSIEETAGIGEIKICKSCNNEATQLVIWPSDSKKEMKEQILRIKDNNKILTGY